MDIWQTDRWIDSTILVYKEWRIHDYRVKSETRSKNDVLRNQPGNHLPPQTPTNGSVMTTFADEISAALIRVGL